MNVPGRWVLQLLTEKMDVLMDVDRDWFRCVQKRFKLIEQGIEISPSRRDSLDGQRFLFSTDDIVCDLISNHYGPGENGIHSNVNGILLSSAYLLGQ